MLEEGHKQSKLIEKERRGKNWSFSVRDDRKYPALPLEQIKSTLLTVWNHRRSQNAA